jgi:hypothetical protein
VSEERRSFAAEVLRSFIEVGKLVVIERLSEQEM